MKGKNEIYSEKLVQRINELYHDLINEEYDHIWNHPEMFKQEKKNWQRVVKRFLNFHRSIKIADIGTGTGFIPLTISNFLNKNDHVFCLDISEKILDIAKKKLEEKDFQPKLECLKIDVRIPYKLPLQTNSIDVVTLNSVIHHIRNLNPFFSEINRILKPNGLVFIGHEPNKYFYDNKFLWYNHLLIKFLIHPRYAIKKFKIKLKAILRNTENRKTIEIEGSGIKKSQIMNEINIVLLQERLVENPLSFEEIRQIVDIRSLEGFKPELLVPYYEILYLETFNHLFWISINDYNKRFVKVYQTLLKKMYPKKGSIFFIVLKKKTQYQFEIKS